MLWCDGVYIHCDMAAICTGDTNVAGRGYTPAWTLMVRLQSEHKDVLSFRNRNPNGCDDQHGV